MITSLALVLVAGLAGWLGSSAWERLELAAASLARNKRSTICLMAVLPLALRLALLPLMPPPVPQAHDEFSYLLSADTLMHGRLTNPTPPLPNRFESIHIIVRPTYSSIFPPAQGLVLALGKIITGNAWAGVLLSIALMAASICWMLQGWVPTGWALLGVTLLVIRLGVFSYWMNSYWGGALAACGGALVLGAVRRLVQRRSITDSLALGFGIAILANSRSFEGAIFTLLCLGLLVYKANKVPILWPAMLMLLLTIAGIAYYSYRVTGNPLQPPYVLYRTTAATAPHFIFLRPRPEQPHWDYAALRDFYTSEMHDYEVARAQPFWAAMVSAEVYWRFYIGVLLTLPFGLAFCDRRARPLFVLIATFFGLALAPQVWHSPHYAASATGLFFLLVTLGMQRLWSSSVGGHRLGAWLTRTLVIATLLFAVRTASIHAADTAGSRWSGWGAQSDHFNRATILGQLPTHERHLVILRYGAHHSPHQEWVYNEADIEQARVVWGRDRGPFDNGDMIEYFQGRRVWLLEPDRTPPRFSPYPSNLLVTPEALAQQIRGQGCGPSRHESCLLSCDQWNFFFERVTSLEAPNVLSGCTDVDRRGVSISLDTWLRWLRAQH